MSVDYTTFMQALEQRLGKPSKGDKLLRVIRDLLGEMLTHIPKAKMVSAGDCVEVQCPEVTLQIRGIYRRRNKFGLKALKGGKKFEAWWWGNKGRHEIIVDTMFLSHYVGTALRVNDTLGR